VKAVTLMEDLLVRDGSEELRVEIRGSFRDASVRRFQSIWESAQSDLFWRQFVVNISGMAEYDDAGYQLLRRLHQHGVVFVAATPRSLDFLEQIASPHAMKIEAPVPRRGSERSLSLRSRHRRELKGIEVNSRVH
jgi:hypothetical protein